MMGMKAKEPYMAFDLAMPTCAMAQSFIQPPKRKAVMMPALIEARRETLRCGMKLRMNVKAAIVKRSVKKIENSRELRMAMRASPTHLV